VKKTSRVRHVAKPRPAVADSTASAPSLDLRINFEYNRSDLTAEGRAQADELGKALENLLREDRKQAVLIGHTDLFGSDRDNEILAQNRAASVKAYLSEHFPVLAAKLSERSMGKRQPLFLEMDDKTQQLNRRVEVKLLQLPE
jgi:outer membrane protein OmpA-like peptidoglycan-associated protein